MARKENLLYLLQTSHGAVKTLLDDINDEESMVRGNDGFNHIRWQVGHLHRINEVALVALDPLRSANPRFAQLFGSGSVVSDNPDTYPSISDLRKLYSDSHGQLIDAISKSTESDLEKEIGEVEKRKILWQRLSFFALHEFYHAGQITHIRKILGRSRPFA